MIWTKAEGCRVTLDDGRELLDLTGGFGVAVLGHRNPRILEAWREQEVVHALGDLADAAVTVRFREALPWPAKLGVTGEDAVEIAIRTAHLANGRPGIVAFDGAYHGTGLLALAATGFEQFREPWAEWLPGPVHRYPYGRGPRRAAGRHDVRRSSSRCRDEPGRSSRPTASSRRCANAATRPARCSSSTRSTRESGAPASSGPAPSVADIVCVGKALGGGLPLSAALFVRDGLAELWRLGPEDVYTHTHVGNPLACAAALVVLDEVPRLLDHVVAMGERFERAGWHGRGLLARAQGELRTTRSSAACSSCLPASTGRSSRRRRR